jgi:hypothetical protein
MDPLTLTALGVFLAPYLQKAGEKVAEKTVEALFDSRKDLADKFTGLFHQEIITLGLNDSTTAEEVTQKLAAKPGVKVKIDKKVSDNIDLLNKLAEALSKHEGGRVIHTKTYIENAGDVIINQ